MTDIAFVPINENCNYRGMEQIFTATWPGSIEKGMVKREVNGIEGT